MSDLPIKHSFVAHLADDLEAEDLLKVLGVFGRDIQRLTGIMADACQAGDLVAFRRAAHGLTGAAGSVGAAALATVSRQAMQLDDGNCAVMAQALGTVRDEGVAVSLDLEKVTIWLRAQIAGGDTRV